LDGAEPMLGPAQYGPLPGEYSPRDGRAISPHSRTRGIKVADLVELLNKIFDIKGLPAKLCALVALVSGAALFLPEKALAQLQVTPLVAKFGPWCGLAFMVAVALLTIDFGIWLLEKAKRTRAGRRRKERLAKELANLSPTEKVVLREFLIQGSSTVSMPVDNPHVAGILSRGYAHALGSLFHSTMAGVVFPVKLDPMVEELLTPAHLDMPAEESEITESVRERIISERPDFTRYS